MYESGKRRKDNGKLALQQKKRKPEPRPTHSYLKKKIIFFLSIPAFPFLSALLLTILFLLLSRIFSLIKSSFSSTLCPLLAFLWISVATSFPADLLLSVSRDLLTVNSL
ncbi:hypothetical protein HRI_001028600 [Hibiscus trionum]|uniref:Uncharacterized protein n=1 Tax=Hibiscus trionum TaxID=183268 RepID=A0A9W7LR01_HIBTR|nr:hypothetical protein HRI_001028600 [Hibiscus trionum]